MSKPKKQAQQVVFTQKAFISPVALLKSVGLYKYKGREDVAVEMEKHLMKLGGLAVHPIHPFKYGYMRIYRNKKDLKQESIGVQSPLTNTQLQTISKFVGIPESEECNSDTKYLNRLKSLLTQKCNVQNPDELSWDEILEHIDVLLSQSKRSSKKPLLSEGQLEVWKLLKRQALSAKELGKLLGLSDENIRQYICKIREKRGYDAIDHTSSRGYWRPDAPPSDIIE